MLSLLVSILGFLAAMGSYIVSNKVDDWSLAISSLGMFPILSAWLWFFVLFVYIGFQKYVRKKPILLSKKFAATAILTLLSFAVLKFKVSQDQQRMETMKSLGNEILATAVKHRTDFQKPNVSLDDLKAAGYKIPNVVIRGSQFRLGTRDSILKVSFTAPMLIICSRNENTEWLCDD